MLPRIETSEVIRRATLAFDEHNRNCPLVTHKRKTAKGEIEVERREGIIQESVTTTFHTLLTEYVHSYNRMREMLPTELQDPTSPPALRTNAVRVAKFARCSDRTVRNHLTRLRDLNFVTTKFHGSKCDFELWITPQYLFGAVLPGTAQNAPENALLPLERKIFPHISTQIQTVETEKGNADMLIVHGESNQGQRGRAETGPEPLGERSINQGQSEVPAGPAARRAAIVAENDRIRREKATAMLDSHKPKMPAGVDPKFYEMLMTFWIYALKVIYPNRRFTQEQHGKALFAISAGVFEHFQGSWNDKQWFDYYQVQMQKLDKAGRYYDNHPDAYRPDPYAVHIPGKGYFDSVNLKGFIGIDAWIKKDSIQHARNRQAYADKQEAKTKRAETLLRTARRDFEKLRIDAQPRKEVKGKDQIGLFTYYNVIFQGLGKKWQQEFCRQYLDQQSRDFQPPAWLQQKKRRALTGENIPATVIMVEDWMHYDEGYES